MEAEDLKRLVVVRMPFGKYQGHLVADLPAPISRGSRAGVFRPANSAACSR